MRALEHGGQRRQRGLDRLDAVAGDEAADGQAEDRHVFHGHPQRGQAAVHGIGADRGQEDDDVADNQEHGKRIRMSPGKNPAA